MKTRMQEVSEKFLYAVTLYSYKFQSVKEELTDNEMINFNNFLAVMNFEYEALNHCIEEYSEKQEMFSFPQHYFDASKNYITSLEKIPNISKIFDIEKMKENLAQQNIEPVNIEDMNEILDALENKAINVVKDLEPSI